MNHNTSNPLPPELGALEARFGLRVGARLTAAADELPHDITERLRFAREQALSRQRLAAVVQPERSPSPVIIGSGPALVLGMPGSGQDRPRWGWVASLLPVLGLLAGLFLIDEWQSSRQIHEAAEIDSALLVDDLPPAAYSDPGFAEFLKATANR